MKQPHPVLYDGEVVEIRVFKPIDKPCATCLHWQRIDKVRGECSNFDLDNAPGLDLEEGDEVLKVETSESFGCDRHEMAQ